MYYTGYALRFLDEDEAIEFIGEASNLGIEWSPSHLIKHEDCVVVIIENVGRYLDLQALWALYNSNSRIY